MTEALPDGVITLPEGGRLWEDLFTVAPLVLVGTREEDGRFDLAPKHMVTPIGWEGHFGFVCTPLHRTYWNARREGVFTVSYPRPRQVVLTSLAATPRCDGDDPKPVLQAIETVPATRVQGVLVRDAYLMLECELDRVVDDFGAASLVVGRIVVAHACRDALRSADRDDQDVIAACPLLAYLSPGRYARVRRSNAFPFPEGLDG